MRPEDCKVFTPRHTMMGFPEAHQCSYCEEAMQVCDNCGGDWHEDEHVMRKCNNPKFKRSPAERKALTE